VLQKVKALAEAAKAKAGGDGGKAVTLADLGISGVHEVAELTPDEVMVRHSRRGIRMAGLLATSRRFTRGLSPARSPFHRVFGDHTLIVLSVSAPQDGIEAALADVTSSILSGEGFAYEVPSRGSGNQKYIPQLDRIVLLKDKARGCVHAGGRQLPLSTAAAEGRSFVRLLSHLHWRKACAAQVAF